MAVSNDSKPILVAILANSIIAVAKAIGYLFSGSSALLSETIHSIADVMNQSLLLLGIKRGEKEFSEMYNYGHSQERFFWNLVSAMGIFVLGCGVTVYHGVHDLLTHEEFKPAGLEQTIILAILVISVLVEGYSFKVAINEISSQAKSRNKKFFVYLNESMDPSVSAVFWEDLAAIIGLFLALIGIICTQIFHNDTFDAVASILIGLLMGGIAFHLALENKRFLLDKSIPSYEMEILNSVLKSNSLIKEVKDVRTVVLGPDRLKFKAEISLDNDAISKRIRAKYSKKLKTNSKNSEKFEKDLIDFSNELIKEKVKELNKIKSDLKKALPNLQHVNLELA
jgi:solute carrier family 30 (zinc transporter), member 9